MAKSALQRRPADSTSVCSTDFRSKVERLMTLSTSAVAVCCWRDSLNSSVRAFTSSNSRAFSIAITAWSAKVVTKSICLSVKGCTDLRASMMTPMAVPSRSSGTPRTVRTPPAARFPAACIQNRSVHLAPVPLWLRASSARRRTEIYEELLEQEHVRELKDDIKLNGGLIDPLIVKDNTFEVLEGNSRLAACRWLYKNDKDNA